MKAVIETRNLAGEAVARVATDIANLDEANEVVVETMLDKNISRVLVFEDARPEGEESIHHNPKFFILRLDAQRDLESGQPQVIGESWPTT